MLTHLDLFAGIGGFSLAAKYLDIVTTDCVEIDSFCQKVLNKNFPNATIHSDVTTYRGNRNSYDIVTFGSPCQDLSLCGQRKGLQGDRSVLFYEAVRILGEIRPQGFVMENVTGIYSYLPAVITSLSQGGLYELQWFSLRVDQLGGAHKRERVFILGKLADSHGFRRRTPRGSDNQERTNETIERGIISKDWENRQAQSGLCGGFNRIPSGLDGCLTTYEEAIANADKGLDNEVIPNRKEKLHALGNAVTPQQAYVSLSILLDWLTVQL